MEVKIMAKQFWELDDSPLHEYHNNTKRRLASNKPLLSRGIEEICRNLE